MDGAFCLGRAEGGIGQCRRKPCRGRGTRWASFGRGGLRPSHPFESPLGEGAGASEHFPLRAGGFPDSKLQLGKRGSPSQEGVRGNPPRRGTRASPRGWRGGGDSGERLIDSWGSVLHKIALDDSAMGTKLDATTSGIHRSTFNATTSKSARWALGAGWGGVSGLKAWWSVPGFSFRAWLKQTL